MSEVSLLSVDYSEFIERAMSSFAADGDQDTHWETAKALIAELGGNAVNIAAFRQQEELPIWLLSSMSNEWLQFYIANEFFKIDPFIPHLKATNTPIALDTGKTAAKWPLNRHLQKAGYSFLYGMPFAGNRSNERKIITYCSGLTASEIDRGDTLSRIRMLGAILTTQFTSSEGVQSAEARYYRRPKLSVREIEVLSWLKSGRRNDQIAHEMGIAEVTVRKHFLSLRRKLGAMTREQALAIALHEGLIGN